MKKKYVLKNKRRFAVFISMLIVLTSLFVYASQVYAFKETKYSIIQVRNGDTLWDIAKDYADGENIREYIYKVKKLNGLENGEIYAGTEIKVPIHD